MSKGKHYSIEEDKYLLQCIKNNPGNIAQGLRTFVIKYPERTIVSASNRYYLLIKKKKHSIFFIVSNKKSIRNRKVVRKGCKKEEKSTSIWKYICKLFK